MSPAGTAGNGGLPVLNRQLCRQRRHNPLALRTAPVGHPHLYEPEAPASGFLLFPIPYGFAPFLSLNLHPFPILSVNNINNNRVEILLPVDPATTPTLRPEPRPRRLMLFQCEEIGKGLTGVKSGVNRHLSNRFCWGSGRFGGCFGEFRDFLGNSLACASCSYGFSCSCLPRPRFRPLLGGSPRRCRLPRMRPSPYSAVNCRNSVAIMASPYSARSSWRTSCRMRITSLWSL